MVSKEECEAMGKIFVPSYTRDGVFVNAYCRKIRSGEEPEYKEWRRRMDQELNGNKELENELLDQDQPGTAPDMIVDEEK